MEGCVADIITSISSLKKINQSGEDGENHVVTDLLRGSDVVVGTLELIDDSEWVKKENLDNRPTTWPRRLNRELRWISRICIQQPIKQIDQGPMDDQRCSSTPHSRTLLVKLLVTQGRCLLVLYCSKRGRPQV